VAIVSFNPTMSVNTNTNNWVPESDYRAALAGIENIPPSNSSSNNTLIKDATKSLQRNLERIVKVVSDKEYQQRLRQNDDNADEEEEESSIEVEEFSIEPDDDDEYDEESLLDQHAIQRVQELRQQVRASALALQELGSVVTNKALVLAQDELSLLSPSVEMQLSLPTATNNTPITLPVPETCQALLLELQELQKIKTCQTALEETIGTIEQGLGRELSRTEQAIRTRSNEGHLIKTSTDAAPEERLATFLGQS